MSRDLPHFVCEMPNYRNRSVFDPIIVYANSGPNSADGSVRNPGFAGKSYVSADGSSPVSPCTQTRGNGPGLSRPKRRLRTALRCRTRELATGRVVRNRTGRKQPTPTPTTYILPFGTVTFRSLSMAVWPYCLYAERTTTADDGRDT